MTRGTRGELRALKFLLENGYVVLTRNYRYRHYEIDLVASHEGVLVFAEVKTRGSKNYGYPEEFVDEDKMDFVRLAAENFIEEHNWQGEIRFDIIAILEKGGSVEITHFVDAF